MFNELSLQGFLAIPPKDVSRRKTLQQRWDVVAPAVVMLELHNNGGKELVRDARAMIEAAPYAEVRAHATCSPASLQRAHPTPVPVPLGASFSCLASLCNLAGFPVGG